MRYILKILKSLRIILFVIIEISILFISLPLIFILLILLLFTRNRNKNKSVFFVGIDHIINKTLVRSDWFENNGYKVSFFSYESRETSSEIKQKYQLEKFSKFISINIIILSYWILKYNPAYLEIYSEKPIWSIFFVMIAKINNILTIFISRGMTRNIKSQCYLAKCCDFVFYRELYMPELFKKFNVPNQKIFYDYNKINVNPIDNYKRIGKNILFLNGFKKWRNIDIFIKSIKHVVEIIPDAYFYLVGARNIDDFKFAQNIVDQENVNNFIKIDYWTKSPEKYYNDASIFVLTAEIIFCNFSLLEAMERGVPAIVTHTNDSDKIIQHSVNGYHCNNNEKELANFIINLLSDEILRQKMGKNARKTIENNFNDSDRMRPILEKIIDRYPYLLR